MIKLLRITPVHTFCLKVALHLVSLSLLLVTYYQAFSDQLGADPVKAILHFTGIGAFNLLLLSLLVSPLAKYLRQGQLVKLRRPIGVYAFVYAACHFTSYLVFELQLQWSVIFSELLKRPYISVGFIALLILTMLTATSTRAIQKRMGSTWQKAHNWVYLAASLVALHYVWSVKSELIQPMIYAMVLLVLLSARKTKFLKPFKFHLNKKTKQTKSQQSKKKLA